MLGTYGGFYDPWLDTIKVTFDGLNRIIYINAGETLINFKVDIYSAWKRWAGRVDNSKWVQAMRSVGGDPTPTGALGETFFLLNGWRIKAKEVPEGASINLTGIVYTEEGATPIIPVSGMSFIMTVSNLSTAARAPAATVTSEDIDSIVNAVWEKDLHSYTEFDSAGFLLHSVNFLEPKVFVNEENEINGCGTSIEPFNNFSAAVDFCEVHGWKSIILLSDATLYKTLKNFSIEGIGLPKIDLNGQKINGSEFQKVKLFGDQNGIITCREVIILGGMTGINGVYKECGVLGKITLADNSFTAFTSSSALYINEPVPVNIDFGENNENAVLNLRKFSGTVQLSNINSVNKFATCHLMGGKFIIDETNTSGLISIAGITDTAIFNNGTSTLNTFGVIPGAETIAATNWANEDAVKLLNDSLGKARITEDELTTIIYDKNDSSQISHRFSISSDKKVRTPIE